MHVCFDLIYSKFYGRIELTGWRNAKLDVIIFILSNKDRLWFLVVF